MVALVASFSPITSKMIKLIARKITHLLHYINVATNEIARRLILSLPPFIRQKLVPIETIIAKNLRGFLIEDIVKYFGVTEKFVKLYMTGQSPLEWAKSDGQKFLDGLPPLERMYAEFTLSTVIRGRNMISLLGRHSCIRRKNRYLDIGTGYGGFLRAFKEFGFRHVVGIEINPNLANLAQANIDDLQDARVLLGDFIKDDFSKLGRFDVITCNDVIEHVDDPVLTIQKMSAMVNDDGCLFLEVPNKDFITFVKSDGHFQIFGITQLLKEDAANYYSAYLGKEKEEYHYQMGEMYELGYYFEQLANAGLSVTTIDTQATIDISDVPFAIDDLKQTYSTWLKEKKPGLNHEIAQKVMFSVENYIHKMETAFFQLTDDTSKQEFTNKYLKPFWSIIASRQS